MSAATSVFHARPFPGMRPFNQDEDDLFFGQAAQVDALVEKLGDSGLIAVMGESGCGKSSLVKAGLIPALRGGSTEPELNLWHTSVSRPAKAPISNLAEQLAAPGALGRPRPGIERQLNSGSYGLVEAVNGAALPEGHRVLVVIDQFEELFRFTKDADSHAVARRDEASLFVKLLLGVTEVRSQTPIYVVLTMRSEYVGDCALFFGLAEAVNRGSYLLPKMTRSQIEAAISGPLKAYGAQIDNHLLQKLLNENEAAQQDGLPLLQHALRRIWDAASKRGAPARLQLGDLTGVKPKAKGDLLIEKHLNEHLDDIYGALTEPDRRTAAKLLKQLGEYDSKGRLVRRSCDLATVAAVCGIEPAAVLGVADRFRNEREGRTFLMPPEDRTAALLSGDEPLDISHEAMLRRWARLRDWIADEAKDADEFQALADRAGKGSASLRGLELARASRWIKDFRPSKVWSLRYAGLTADQPPRSRYDYDLAMEYFRRSLKWAWFRRIAWSLAGVLVLAAISGYAIHLDAEQGRRLEAQRKISLARALEAQKNSEERSRAAQQEKYEASLKAENDQLQTAKRTLEKVAVQLLDALKDKTGALDKVQKASDELERALKETNDARVAAEGDRKQAESDRDKADKAAQDAAAARAETRGLYDQLKIASDRRDAEQRFGLVAGQPIKYADRFNPQEQSLHLRALKEAAQAVLDKGGQLSYNAADALYQALAMTHNVDGSAPPGAPPVLFAYSGTERLSGLPFVIRQGDLPTVSPRPGWTVQRGATTAGGDMVFGGPGGFVAVQASGKLKPTPPRKMFPFAISGLGFSTNGKWIAAADSSGNMRIQRSNAFESNMAVTRRLVQVASGFKLFMFLVSRRFQGEYGVRQWALSVPKGDAAGRRDVSAAALTDSGRLLVWERPGPIGKQVSRTSHLTVGKGDEFTAITTNPRTQQVWASSHLRDVGIVDFAARAFHACFQNSKDAGTTSAMAWNDTGSMLALGLSTGRVKILREASPCTLVEVVTLPAHGAAVTTAIWKDDLLTTGSADGSAQVWNLKLDKDEESLFADLENVFGEAARSHSPQAARILQRLPVK